MKDSLRKKYQIVKKIHYERNIKILERFIVQEISKSWKDS